MTVALNCCAVGFWHARILQTTKAREWNSRAEILKSRLATGVTTSYGAGDDGAVQAGAPLRYRDNGDGTISDLNTGLMWEKKIKGDGVVDGTNLHDADNIYSVTGYCSGNGAPCLTEATCPSGETCNAPCGCGASCI